MKSASEIVLKRANGINISIDSGHTVTVLVDNKRKLFANDALTVLTVFAQPLSLKVGLKRIQVSGAYDWIQLTSVISKLREIGALIDASGKQFIPDKDRSSFGSPTIHLTMLNDRARTDSFIKGISEVVKQGDIVLDIGTGTGILAIAAARAGASRVYAIEASAIADVAQATIDSTEVAGKITLIRGWSTQIELPEKADVLVSEIIGNDPFAENVLRVFQDAHQRLLKPSARIVPGKIKVFGLLVAIPACELQNKLVQKQDLENWHFWYGIDFSALKTETFGQVRPAVWMDSEKAKSLSIYDEPLLLTEVDFTGTGKTQVEARVSVIAKQPFNGLLLYFELELGNTLMNNHPLTYGRSGHWPNPVWFMPEAEKINTGDKFIIHYNCPGNRSEIRLIPDKN